MIHYKMNFNQGFHVGNIQSIDVHDYSLIINYKFKDYKNNVVSVCYWYAATQKNPIISNV